MNLKPTIMDGDGFLGKSIEIGWIMIVFEEQ